MAVGGGGGPWFVIGFGSGSGKNAASATESAPIGRRRRRRLVVAAINKERLIDPPRCRNVRPASSFFFLLVSLRNIFKSIFLLIPPYHQPKSAPLFLDRRQKEREREREREKFFSRNAPRFDFSSGYASAIVCFLLFYPVLPGFE